MSKFESIIKANDIRLNEWYFGTLSVKGGLGICGWLLGEKGEAKECECCFRFYHSKVFGYGVKYYTLNIEGNSMTDSEGSIMERDNRLIDCKVARELDSEESSELNRLTAI